MAAPSASATCLVLAAAILGACLVSALRDGAITELAGGAGGGGSSAGGGGLSAYPTLRFRADGTFKVLQLTDLHYGEDKRLDELSDQANALPLRAVMDRLGSAGPAMPRCVPTQSFLPRTLLHRSSAPCWRRSSPTWLCLGGAAAAARLHVFQCRCRWLWSSRPCTAACPDFRRRLPPAPPCSGDMVSGWVCVPSPERPLPVDCGPGWFERRWRQLIAPVHAAGLPYAVTLGNHE